MFNRIFLQKKLLIIDYIGNSSLVSKSYIFNRRWKKCKVLSTIVHQVFNKVHLVNFQAAANFRKCLKICCFIWTWPKVIKYLFALAKASSLDQRCPTLFLRRMCCMGWSMLVPRFVPCVPGILAFINKEIEPQFFLLSKPLKLIIHQKFKVQVIYAISHDRW